MTDPPTEILSPATGTGATRASRILIVEDERRLTRFLAKGLRSHGFAATAVEDGGSALRLARSADFDLMILDLGLPDIDGLDVLEELRRRGESLPVVILSARDDAEDRAAGFAHGADEYVTKPFGFQDLVGRIRTHLGSEIGR